MASDDSLYTVKHHVPDKRTFFLVLTLLFAFIAAACQAAPATPVDKDAERYAAYSAVIADAGGLPVVSDRIGGVSWTDRDFDRVHEGIEQVDRALWENLGASNDHTELLQKRFDAELGEVPLANWADLGILFSKNKPAEAWAAFNERYPGKCLLSVSNIGFNEEMDEAVLYASFVCDEKSGSGKIIYLAKAGGKWTVQAKATLWGQ